MNFELAGLNELGLITVKGLLNNWITGSLVDTEIEQTSLEQRFAVAHVWSKLYEGGLED